MKDILSDGSDGECSKSRGVKSRGVKSTSRTRAGLRGFTIIVLG